MEKLLTLSVTEIEKRKFLLCKNLMLFEDLDINSTLISSTVSFGGKITG